MILHRGVANLRTSCANLASRVSIVAFFSIISPSSEDIAEANPCQLAPTAGSAMNGFRHPGGNPSSSPGCVYPDHQLCVNFEATKLGKVADSTSASCLYSYRRLDRDYQRHSVCGTLFRLGFHDSMIRRSKCSAIRRKQMPCHPLGVNQSRKRTYIRCLNQ
jgi:hypothetical protein